MLAALPILVGAGRTHLFAGRFRVPEDQGESMKKKTKQPDAFSIGKGWKKWFAVGCSHGDNIDPEARAAALAFKERWKPDTTIHLGDFIDLSGFRAGAVRDSNDPDHADDIITDLVAGVEFLHELEPQYILCGNHEARLYRLSKSPNAVLAYAANMTIGKIQQTAESLKAKLTPYSNRSWIELGDTKFMHGHMCNVAAIRDHAEAHGNVVIAHLHRVGWERARRSDSASGYCVGMLADFGMEYASATRSNLAWSQGFAYGYYSDKTTTVNLCERKHNHPWLLPM